MVSDRPESTDDEPPLRLNFPDWDTFAKRTATMTIAQTDLDIANDICDAIAEKFVCRAGGWPNGMPISRVDVLNIVAVRVAMQRRFLP